MGDEAGADALDFVGAGFAAGEDGAIGWLDRDGEEVGVAGFEVLADVGEAGEEAADAADGDADAKRNGEEVSGAGVDVLEALDEFDGEPATEESSDDGFAAG